MPVVDRASYLRNDRFFFTDLTDSLTDYRRRLIDKYLIVRT